MDYAVSKELFDSSSSVIRAALFLTEFMSLPLIYDYGDYETKTCNIPFYNKGNLSVHLRACLNGLEKLLDGNEVTNGKRIINFNFEKKVLYSVNNDTLGIANFSELVRYSLISHYYLNMNINPNPPYDKRLTRAVRLPLTFYSKVKKEAPKLGVTVSAIINRSLKEILKTIKVSKHDINVC